MSELTQKITNIVKSSLNCGIISLHDNLHQTYHADAEDIIHIIDDIEREFNIEFSDAEHFSVKCINDIVKIVKSKIHVKQETQP